MGNYSFKDNVVYLGGDVSINSGDELLDFLRRVSPDSNSITVDLKNVESWDSTSLQMLISFKKSIGNVKVRWKDFPRLMFDDIKLMGLSSIFSEDKND